MAEHTRRDFLKRTAMAGGAMALAPLGNVAAQDAPAQMCIARWKGPADAQGDVTTTMATKLTEQAVAAIGGMKRFVSQGDVVWVKPNIAWDRAPQFGANTNPDLVATLVRLCLEAGAKTVKVGDNPCNPAKKTYPNSGIEAAAKAAGAEVVYLDKKRFKDVAIKGERLDKWLLYPEIIESDLVINCPIVKDHATARATVCMKNYMGVIGGQRGLWHQNLAVCLCDITAFMKPQMCVVDATRIMTGNGPTGGNLSDVKQMNTVAAGTDVVALDAFGAELLGLDPAKVESIATGQAAGLGTIDYRSLALKELEVA